jgi:3-carboxy-cis,cis-muconate cycloisomerase
MVPIVLGAMEQEHERAAGGWQAEWDAVPRVFSATAAALQRVTDAVSALHVDAERMRAVSQMTDGRILSEVLSAALIPRLGRGAAQRAISEASATAGATGRSFQEALHERLVELGTLDQDELDRLLEPRNAWGSSGVYIDRAIERYRLLQEGFVPAG